MIISHFVRICTYENRNFGNNEKIYLVVVNMNFRRLADLRDSLDLYQKDVAKIIGVSQQTYSAWETGDKIIPLKHLNTLANFYHVGLDYLLNLTNNKENFNNDFKLDKKLIGKNLCSLRKEHNLTLRELANILNTSPSTIHAYETGKTLILTAFIYELAKRFNISIDVLIGKKKKLIQNTQA